MTPKLNDRPFESHGEHSAFWVLIADTLLFAAGMLIYLKWDEDIRGPWYPRGWLLEIAIFFLILFT